MDSLDMGGKRNGELCDSQVSNMGFWVEYGSTYYQDGRGWRRILEDS